MAEADRLDAGETNAVLEGLINRNSTPPRLFDGRVPPRADIDRMLEAAMTAPDHGLVRPWRFHIVEGDARHRLGELFAEAITGAGDENGLAGEIEHCAPPDADRVRGAPNVPRHRAAYRSVCTRSESTVRDDR